MKNAIIILAFVLSIIIEIIFDPFGFYTKPETKKLPNEIHETVIEETVITETIIEETFIH